MLLDTLGASLLQNMFAGKGVLRASYGNKEEKRIVRAGYRSSIKMQMLVHIGLLCIVEILKLLILTFLELNMFLKKLKNLLGIKT